MKITEDLEFRDWLFKLIRERDGGERIGIHMSDLNYCFTPDTRVLKSDLTWAELDAIEVGDELVGIDETTSVKRRRHMLPCLVTHKEYRTTECMEVVFDNGQVLVASTDHPWLTRKNLHCGQVWVQTDRLQPGWKVCWLQKPWELDRTREGGYIAGFYDGEGCVYRGIVQVAQKPGEEIDRVVQYLEDNNYGHYSDMMDNGVRRLHLNAVGKTMRFLGSVRPERLLRKRSWIDVFPAGRVDPSVHVVSVRPVGLKEVVTIETTSGTYCAEGFWAHNCLNKTLLKKLNPRPETDQETLLFGMGWMTQRWLTGQDKDIEEKEVDGIIVTCDALDPLGMPWELKATYQSANKPILENPHWIRQIMAQCKVIGTTTAYLSRYEIMGDWGWVFPKGSTPEEKKANKAKSDRPTLHTYRLYFTKAEINRNWEWFRGRRSLLMMMLDDNTLRTKPIVLPPGQAWECDWCEFRVKECTK